MVSQTQPTATPPAANREAHIAVNQPTKGFPGLQLRELWQFRELTLFLTWRDLRVRYAQTVMGFGWVVINPLITMLVFGFVFGTLVEVDTYGVPYPLFSFAALVPWTLFSRGWTTGANSINANQALVNKIYFPRLILPVYAFATAFVDFLVALVVLFLMMILALYPPSANMLAILYFTLITALTSLGLGFWFSALQVRMRDITYVLPYMIQVLLYVTPIGFPSSLVEGPIRWAYSLNPLVAVCDGFRWALLGTPTLWMPSVIIGSVVALALFVSGMVYFRSQEGSFVDYM